MYPPQGPIWPYLAYTIVIPVLWLLALFSISRVRTATGGAYEWLGVGRVPVTAGFVFGFWMLFGVWVAHLPKEAQRRFFVGTFTTDRYGPPREVSVAAMNDAANSSDLVTSGPIVDTTPPINPLAVIQEQNNELKTQLADTQTQLADALKRIATLEGANRRNETAPVAPPKVAQPPIQPADPVPQRAKAFSLVLDLEADPSCAAWGAKAELLSNSEKQFLNDAIPRFKGEAKGFGERIIAVDQGNIDPAVTAISGWRNRLGNSIDNVFGPLAELDYRNAAPSDAIVESLPLEVRKALAGRTIGTLANLAGALSCLEAIESNLAKRQQP
jgi:hypothetical protein